MFFVGIVVIIAVIIFVIKSMIIVEQQEAVIIQRLGQYYKTLTPGLQWIVPFIDAPRPMLKLIKQKGMYYGLYTGAIEID